MRYEMIGSGKNSEYSKNLVGSSTDTGEDAAFATVTIPKYDSFETQKQTQRDTETS